MGLYLLKAESQLAIDLFDDVLKSCEEGLKVDPNLIQLKIFQGRALICLQKNREAYDLFMTLYSGF